MAAVVEKISDPLMHLVRNALDHGIESPEDRRTQGKDEMAHVYLNAYHDAGTVVIEVADDGAGLDREKILAKAIAKGLATADRPPLAGGDGWGHQAEVDPPGTLGRLARVRQDRPGAVFVNVPISQDHNLVGPLNGTEAVGDDNSRPAR